MLVHWHQKCNLYGRQISSSTVLLAAIWHDDSWSKEISERRRDLLIHLCKREIDRLQVTFLSYDWQMEWA